MAADGDGLAVVVGGGGEPVGAPCEASLELGAAGEELRPGVVAGSASGVEGLVAEVDAAL